MNIPLSGVLGQRQTVRLFQKAVHYPFQGIRFGTADDRSEIKQNEYFKLSKSLVKKWTMLFDPISSKMGVGIVYRSFTPRIMYPTLGSLKEIKSQIAKSVIGALTSTLSMLYRDTSDRMETQVAISNGQEFTPYVKAQILFRLGVYDRFAKGFSIGAFQTKLPLDNVPKLPKKIQQQTDDLLKALHDELLRHALTSNDPRMNRLTLKDGRMSFDNILPFDPDTLLIPRDNQDVPKVADLMLSPPEKISVSQVGGSQGVSVRGGIQQTFLVPDMATGQNNLLARVNTSISFSDNLPNNFLPYPAVDEVIRTLYREQAQGGIQPLLNALTAKDLRKEELIEKHDRKTITKKQLGWKSDGTGQLWGSTLPWPEKRTVPVLIEALGKTVDLEITIPSIEFKDFEGKSYRIINFGERW